MYEQDLQEAGVSAGDLGYTVVGAAPPSMASQQILQALWTSVPLQVIQFAQDLALDELEIETCGCLGECLLQPFLLQRHLPHCSIGCLICAML